MALYNFSAASSLDETLFVSCRPGCWPCPPSTEAVPEADVAAWATFISSRGVTRVLSLLGPDEVAAYAAPVGAALAAKGITDLACVRPSEPGAYAACMAFIGRARAVGARVIVHCWGGGGRAGRVAAAGISCLKN